MGERVVILYIFISLLMGVLLWFLVYAIVETWDWQDEFLYLTLYFFKTPENRRFEPCLTFSQFLSFYNLNPKKWGLYLNSVESEYSDCSFNFTTYGELYKYRMWKRKIDDRAYRKRALENLNKKIGKLTEGVRAEIEKSNAEAEAKAREVYEEVRKRCE